ncbi:MAG: hypothetical protein V4660_07865 [Pseudomonadota bacterium]
MKRVVGFFQAYGTHPLLFAKDYLALARHYLIVPNRTHRLFTITAAILFVIFIGLFIAYAFVEKHQLTDNPLFGGVKFSFVDGGYPEIFGYFLEFFCISVFTVHALANKKTHWLAWAAIFLIVLLDDSIGAHEVLANVFFDEETLSPVMGGIAVFAVMGLMFAGLWLVGLMAMPHNAAEFSAYILLSIYFAALVLVGVGVDSMHAYLKSYFHLPDTALTLAEDGTELFLTALMASTALGLWYRDSDKLQQHYSSGRSLAEVVPDRT